MAEELFTIFARLTAILIATDVFEFTKALASHLQGDTLPKAKGELSLNPFRHFEPIGFILLFFESFGWGRPVETSQVNYKNKNRGILITYCAPIIASLIFAFLIKLLMIAIIMFGRGLGLGFSAVWDYVNLFLMALRQYFIILAVINIIPVPPMCGSRIIRCFLSPNGQVTYSRNEKLFQMIMLFFLFLGVGQPIILNVVSLMMKIV